MEICFDTHDEIVFVGKHCPVCPLVEEIEDLKREIERMSEDK